MRLKGIPEKRLIFSVSGINYISLVGAWSVTGVSGEEDVER